MLKVLELFAGIGACSKALTNLGIEHEIVDAVEVDKFAIRSFNAIHGTNFESQDITKWDKDIECDLIMHGSPCQDFSFAGKQAGGDEGSGTRSSLMYESLRIIGELKPKYVIWENVKAVLSKKHRPNFDAYQERMSELGYQNFYQVLNAKDYGVPQNRERVFTVSIRGPLVNFSFPHPQALRYLLKDLLEPAVDERYYLSDEKIAKMRARTELMQEKGYGFRYNPEREVCSTLSARDYKDPKCVRVGGLDIKGQDCIKRVYSPEGVSPTLTTMGGGNREPKIVAMRGRNPDNPSDRTAGAPTEQRLEANIKGVSNTLTSVQKDNLVLEPEFRVRKLTERECWRLMGFDDEDVDKVKAIGMSKSQMYKQAGNSIVVDVLEAILSNLLLPHKML